MQPALASDDASIPSPRPAATFGDAGRLGDVHWRLLAARALVGWVSPFVASRVRTRLLRAAGIAIGKSSAFWGFPRLVGSGAIERRLVIGAHCGFNAGAFFELENSVTIGDHVSVGQHVTFLTRTHAVGPPGERAGARRRAPIVVGNGAWLGARATILAGVTIGARSVIGAGVTVIKDVPEDTLLTGAPPISIARWR